MFAHVYISLLSDGDYGKSTMLPSSVRRYESVYEYLYDDLGSHFLGRHRRYVVVKQKGECKFSDLSSILVLICIISYSLPRSWRCNGCCARESK